MIAFLEKIWPSLIPICGYFIWWLKWGRNHKKNGTLTAAHKNLWRYTLACSLLFGILSLLFLAFMNQSNVDADYVPAQIKDGKVVPGEMRKEGVAP